MSTITLPWVVRTIGKQIADITGDIVGIYPMNIRIPRHIKLEQRFKATFHYDFANVTTICKSYETNQGIQYTLIEADMKLVTDEKSSEVLKWLIDSTNTTEWKLLKKIPRGKEGFFDLFFTYNKE